MNLEPILKLNKDLKEASVTLSKDEARFLVDAYYQMQGDRIRGDNRVRSLSKSGEPHEILVWLAKQSETLEGQIKNVLGRYAEAHLVGDWLMAVDGIGPVIAAGLLAHIDMEYTDADGVVHEVNTAGKIWSYAGIASGKLEQKWEKGEKRPWNAALKTLCWKAGESFVKVSGKEGAYYGQLYRERKDKEVVANDNFKFKDLAASYLEEYKIGKTTDAYKAYILGKLPPAHIHARAKRYAVKMFLSHLHHVWYTRHFKKAPPKPFVIAHLGHADFVAPPGFNQ